MSFHALVNGQQRGLGAACARAALRVAETPYTWAVRWRNWRYDRGRAAVQHVGVPVVSVGNLTLGGTGKTPFVAWLAQWYLDRGVRVGLVSRGYRSQPGRPNDEALELAQRLPGVPHVQHPDRVAAAREVIAQGCQLVIADDAFQHRRLGRDLDIVLLDAREPFGGEHVFPRGLLREPLAGIARADVVALSRANQVDADRRRAIHDRVRQFNPHAIWLETEHRPTRLVSSAGDTLPLDALRDAPVFAFCGLGNPHAFRDTLVASGATLVGWREFPDHHPYAPTDLAALAQAIAATPARLAVTTSKDLVKLPSPTLDKTPLWSLAIELQITTNTDALTAKLQSLQRPEVSGADV